MSLRAPSLIGQSAYATRCFLPEYHCEHKVRIIRGRCSVDDILPSGAFVFSRIPTASNSASSSLLCSVDFVASTMNRRMTNQQARPYLNWKRHSLMMTTTSAVFATLTTWRPRPRPMAAPSTIPGRSKSCTLAPSYSNTPGIACK